MLTAQLKAFPLKDVISSLPGKIFARRFSVIEDEENIFSVHYSRSSGKGVYTFIRNLYAHFDNMRFIQCSFHVTVYHSLGATSMRVEAIAEKVESLVRPQESQNRSLLSFSLPRA